jgi:hypothetical protein
VIWEDELEVDHAIAVLLAELADRHDVAGGHPVDGFTLDALEEFERRRARAVDERLRFGGT